MNCANCQAAMITAEIEQVEADFCPDCGGIWLDAGEMEILLGGSEQSKTFMQALAVVKTREKTRRCPICLKRMKKITAGANGQTVLLDKCQREHGLWFDGGELQQIVQFAKLDNEGKLAALLENLFKHHHKG